LAIQLNKYGKGCGQRALREETGRGVCDIGGKGRWGTLHIWFKPHRHPALNLNTKTISGTTIKTTPSGLNPIQLSLGW